MGQVIDFETGKVLEDDASITSQRESFDREATADQISEIMRELHESGYNVAQGIVVMSHNDKPADVAIVSTSPGMDMVQMDALLTKAMRRMNREMEEPEKPDAS